MVTTSKAVQRPQGLREVSGDNRAKAEARVLRGAQDFARGDSKSRFSLARLAAAPQGVLNGQHSMSTFCSSTDMSSLGPRKMLMRSENRTGNSAGCSLPVNSAAALTPPQHRAYRLLKAQMVKARHLQAPEGKLKKSIHRNILLQVKTLQHVGGLFVRRFGPAAVGKGDARQHLLAADHSDEDRPLLRAEKILTAAAPWQQPSSSLFQTSRIPMGLLIYYCCTARGKGNSGKRGDSAHTPDPTFPSFREGSRGELPRIFKHTVLRQLIKYAQWAWKGGQAWHHPSPHSSLLLLGVGAPSRVSTSVPESPPSHPAAPSLWKQVQHSQEEGKDPFGNSLCSYAASSLLGARTTATLQFPSGATPYEQVCLQASIWIISPRSPILISFLQAALWLAAATYPLEKVTEYLGIS
ncbi:hypothetical protein Anapl_11911 [Anas platyrhynchos]|uniref:Uncharacterized protein n=1 Tax=Anas platyrhynchos TaxID=8839 RepID=R0K2Z0_ANAPL|nr:hypothetical protein Anapl_11911 [Anas platyrhynchos]